MPVRIATSFDIDDWVSLRTQLWDDTGRDAHLAEIDAILAGPPGECIAFLDFTDDNRIRGFAEAALRHDHVNGCDTSPVAFLEGIFVCPDDRGCGIARNLVAAVETWAHAQGCSELASDAHLDNLISQTFHQATGFKETDRVVYFRKLL